jgi:tripartite-type tricarboxylate transporter receptor subunit TctC
MDGWRRGAVPRGSSPEEFDRFVRAEDEKLGRIIRAAGVKAE